MIAFRICAARVALVDSASDGSALACMAVSFYAAVGSDGELITVPR